MAELPVPVICRIAGASDLLAELSECGQCATDLAELPVCGEASQEIVRIAYASDLAELSVVCG